MKALYKVMPFNTFTTISWCKIKFNPCGQFKLFQDVSLCLVIKVLTVKLSEETHEVKSSFFFLMCCEPAGLHSCCRKVLPV